METALAVIARHESGLKGFTYTILTGPHQGVSFMAADAVRAGEIGLTVQVRFSPDDQYAQQI